MEVYFHMAPIPAVILSHPLQLGVRTGLHGPVSLFHRFRLRVACQLVLRLSITTYSVVSGAVLTRGTAEQSLQQLG